MIINIEEDFRKLNKEILVKILNKLSIDVSITKNKDELIDILLKKCKTKKLVKEIYIEYKKELGLKPFELELILGCSKTERLRWQKEGKLEIVGYDSFKSYGKIITYPLYDVFHTRNIKESSILKWRDEHKKETQKSNKIGRIKTKKTKAVNDSIRKSFKDEYNDLVSSWNKIDLEMSKTYQLAYWTQWISRWAKEMQVKSFKNTSEKHLEEKERLYRIKNDSIKLLSNNKFAINSVYKPEISDKLKLFLCEKHYGNFCDSSFCYYGIIDYYYNNKKKIDNCDDCEKTILETNYYSLIFTEIKSELDNNLNSFSFHTPFNLINDELVIESLPILDNKKHKPNDGIFSFGRKLYKDEKIIFTLAFVEKKHKEALSLYCKNKD